MNSQMNNTQSTMRPKNAIGQKALAVLVSALLVFSFLPASALASRAYAADDIYEISTYDDLVQFRDYVNSSTANLSANAELCADITVNDKTWTPIGDTSGSGSSAAYSGTFDGAGHTITFTGVENTASTRTFQGFFGSASGTIKDLTLDGSFSLTSTYGITGVGGFVGYSYGATITGCVNNMTIEVNGYYEMYGGGLVGCDDGSTIVNCGNVGNVTVNGSGSYHRVFAGGIIAGNNAMYYSSSSGGRTCIENCYNWGNVTARSASTGSSSYADAGGIIGYIPASYSNDLSNYVYNCYNAGAVSAELTGGGAESLARVGAIAGYVYLFNDSRYTYLEDCYWSEDSGLSLYSGKSGFDSLITDGSETYSYVDVLLANLNSNERPQGASGAADYKEWFACAERGAFYGLPCFVESEETFSITVDSTDRVDITVSAGDYELDAVPADTEVVVSVQVNEGFVLGGVFWVDEEGSLNEIALVDGVGTFTMPASDVTVYATWITILTADMFTVDTTDVTYTGYPIEKMIVSDLELGIDYTVTYSDDCVNVGEVTITIVGIGSYTGELTYTYLIKPASLFSGSLDMDEGPYIYHGSPVEPDFTVTVNGNVLIADVDYTYEYADNDAPGTATLTVWGAGNYESDTSLSAKFILYGDITDATVTLPADSYPYTGSAIEPTPTVIIDGEILQVDRDYAVSYNRNVDVGTAMVSITGIGNYTGALAYEFAITRVFTRLAGDDRYGTMEEVDDEGFDTADVVVLTVGGNFPDALAAAGFAGTLDAPVILTATDELSAEAAEEIERLGATNVVIIGGENSVSPEVVNELSSMGVSVLRVSGADRYATATEVYYAGMGTWNTSENAGTKTAIIASGENFADTLSASSYAWWSTSPLFLASSDGLDEKTKAAIENGEFERIIIVGGVNSVPSSVEVWAYEIAPTLRISGENRYATSAAFAEWAYGEGMSFNNVGIATGKTFPDALAGGALCGKRGSVVLLADVDATDGTAAIDLLASHKDEVSRVYYLGGENSVTPELAELVESSLE